MNTYVWPGCATVSPFIVVSDAMDVVAFAKVVFGAELLDEPLLRADGTLSHAVVRIGDSTIMLGSPPAPEARSTAFLHVYVADADAAYDRALAAGASPIAPPMDQFYGDRAGGVTDKAGNTWWIATHQRSVPRPELERLQREAELARIEANAASSAAKPG